MQHISNEAAKVPSSIRRFPVQFPTDTRLSLGTQPYYEAPGDPWVENVNCSD